MSNNGKITRLNPTQFLLDLKDATEVMVWAQESGQYFSITKKQLKETVQHYKIEYRMTREIFLVKRLVMVIK